MKCFFIKLGGDIMANTKTISINELKPGMRVSKAIENEYGAVLVSPGMIINKELILKLKRLKINKIDIIDESMEQLEKNIHDFPEKYRKNVKSTKKVFQSINKGNELEFSQIKKIVDETTNIDTNRDIVGMLSKIRSVDEYTYTHSINVGLMAMMFGRWTQLNRLNTRMLLYAGLLHDIGKAKVPDEILNKKGKLNADEFEVIKKHTVSGYKLIKKCSLIPEKVARAVLLHHERNNGNGYPFGFKKEKISFMARVLAIIDTFDAITSDRVYREHKPPFSAFKVFEKDLHSYDIKLAKIFMSNISQYYLNERVKLDNGQIGEIVYINPNHISRPIIKIGNKEYLDLYQTDIEIQDLFVEDILKTGENQNVNLG